MIGAGGAGGGALELSSQTEVTILDLGVRSFVSKPYSIAQLAAAMAELVRG